MRVDKTCDYDIRTEGKNRVLHIDCRDCMMGMSIEDSKGCMGGILHILLDEHDIDFLILSDVVEREYNRTQTGYLRDLAGIYEETRSWPFTNLKPQDMDCEECIPERKKNMEDILDHLILMDPVSAYTRLLTYTDDESRAMEGADDPRCVECSHHLINENLTKIRDIFEATPIFSEMRNKLHEIDSWDRTIYRKYFSPTLRPHFSTSRILFEPPPGSRLMDNYKVGDTDVRILMPPDKPEILYFISPPEYSLPPEDFDIINEARGMMINHQPGDMGFADPSRARDHFKRLAKKLVSEAAAGSGREVSREKIEALSEILTKYTAGLGVLEVLLNDSNIQDVYINAPASESPILIYHASEEDCVTNVYLTEDDTDSLISRFRGRSGRAFSEASPTLDMELSEYGTRVAAIGRPLSPDGLAFALRRQKTTPWTLPQFVANGTLTAQAAGLLSFLIDGQVTMLVTGSRGAGKTSLLVSLMGEFMQKLRILTIEDTLEIPVPALNSLGYRIQRLKIQSSVGRSEVEMSPQDALGTALRLGESALVIGEVRGPETKVLYESMRVGAAGNSVLGTIHGANTQSVFERVVYDIGIPASSFKATDIVVTSAPIRKGGGLKRFRRVQQISEVKKDWYQDNPDPKDVFQDLLVYNPASDALESTDIFAGASEIIGTIATRWNITYEDALKSINMRGKIKQDMVDTAAGNDMPELLELEHVVAANNMLRLLNEHQIQGGGVDYESLYSQWGDWFTGYVESTIRR